MIPSSSLSRKACGVFTALLVASSSLVAVAQNTKEKDPTVVTVQGPVQVQGTVGVQGPVEIQGYVEVLNDALRTTFNRRISGTIAPNNINAIFSLPAIPAGKRLVIEAIGVAAVVKANTKATAFLLLNGTESISLPIPLTPQGAFGLDPREHCMGLHQVRIVVDPRVVTSMQLNVFRNIDFTEAASVTCNLMGYLEDIPAATP